MIYLSNNKNTLSIKSFSLLSIAVITLISPLNLFAEQTTSHPVQSEETTTTQNSEVNVTNDQVPPTEATEEKSQIDILRELAGNYQKNKQYQESIIIYQSLLKVEPNHVGIHLDLALSYYYSKNFQLAKEHIDFVKAQPSYQYAPEKVRLNVEKIYKSITSRLKAVEYKDPTFPSNKKTWDAFVSVSALTKNNATNLADDYEENKKSATSLSYQLFLNYKLIKPLENWRLDQNLYLYQLHETLSNNAVSEYRNLNYNIGYKKVLFGKRILSSELSAFLSSSQFIEEPSLSMKLGYQFNNQQFLFSTKKHWPNNLNKQTDENEDIIEYESYWTFTTQYKSSKTWLIEKDIHSFSFNWKTKPSFVTGDTGYFRIEQQIGSSIKINDNMTWLTQLQLRHQQYQEFDRTDFETRWYQTFNYDFNKNWLLSVTQQYKNRQSTASDDAYNFDYDQWQYQLTLKWVN